MSVAIAVAPDSTLSRLTVGAIAGLAGMGIGSVVVSQATTLKTSGDNVFEDAKDLWNSTAGNVIGVAGDLLTGGLYWWLGAAASGAAANLLAGAITGGQVFPLVFSVASGFGMNVLYTLEDPPSVPAGIDSQGCVDGDLVGCTIKNADGTTDMGSSIQNSVKTNYLYMISGLPGLIYMGYKTISGK